jgi:hypothetical protein
MTRKEKWEAWARLGPEEREDALLEDPTLLPNLEELELSPSQSAQLQFLLENMGAVAQSLLDEAREAKDEPAEGDAP